MAYRKEEKNTKTALVRLIISRATQGIARIQRVASSVGTTDYIGAI